ncbi:hypothetical protein [Fimbriiglobus ruber]|uniref:RNA polymerase sigma-70 region 4 domain-containing protein n=1 Tax=Fimbriiglobus ruber TaxID=1908690 RepID=A0A225E1J8_9BACT|nr:hypothetical protein [Fimbriiglobus ruber]OWK42247.1 hypothetical protein FRUB_04325 [Fimbriiglobus ruber]
MRAAARLAWESDASGQPTRSELAERFGVSLEVVAHALREVKARYERLLRQEVRDQVGSEEEIEADLRALLEPRVMVAR